MPFLVTQPGNSNHSNPSQPATLHTNDCDRGVCAWRDGASLLVGGDTHTQCVCVLSYLHTCIDLCDGGTAADRERERERQSIETN